MKTRTLLFFLCYLLFLRGTAQRKTHELSVTQMTCEYLTNPVGINTSAPQLAWIIRSNGRNIKQTAYRILVSDDERLIKSGKGNIWDSGKRMSGESIQVPYAGPSLHAATKYYWRVQVWDNFNESAELSPVASWYTGLTSATDWENARWIGYDTLPDTKKIIPAAHFEGKPEWGNLRDTLPVLRREFAVNKPLKDAVIFICGLGHFDLTLNGKKTGDHFLDPGWTQYSRHALYAGFDITSEIKPGKNAIGIMLGNGFYHVPAERYRKLTGTFGHPKLICRLVLHYRDGTVENIVTNESWKVAPSPITFSSIYGGEDYDARLHQHGWNISGFDDRKWRQAVVTTGPPVLQATMTEPLKIKQEFTVVKTIEPKRGVYIYDFGQNFSGIPAITVKGKKGTSIKIIPGEILDSNGLVSQRPSGGPVSFNYILNGNGNESWQPQFTYYGFRYLQIEGAIPQEKEATGQNVLLELKGLHTRHSAKTVGEFSCSNPLFNEIFKLIDWSIKSNLASVLTDCPHREKLAWLEVAHLMGNSVRYNYDIASLYRKIILDMKMSQLNNGLVPNIAPEYVQFDPDFRDSPEWGSSSVILPYSLYQWYGDKRVLEENYEMMKGYVDYLGTRADNYIVSHGLGDWFDIGPNGSGSGYSVSTPQGITATAIYYYDLTILSRVASLLGKDADVVKYQNLAAQVKIAFNNKFFDARTKQYGTGSQTANAMAVHFGLVNPGEKEAVVCNIKQNIRERNNRLSSGEVGYKSLLAVLELEGASDFIYDMNSRSDVPGYGYQIAHGATTLMEDWQAIKTLGNNHCMLGHLLGWLYSGVGGIRQHDSAVAFKRIIISPEPVGDIRSAKTQYHSPYGEISSEWQKTGNSFILDVNIPANTDADIYLPGDSTSSAYLDAKRLTSTEKQHKKGKIKLTLGSGRYRIEVKKASADLIPMPQSIKQSAQKFDVSKCTLIVPGADSLQGEALHLQEELKSLGFNVGISATASSAEYSISLAIGNVPAPGNANEAYRLEVKNNAVLVTANTLHGIFNGAQTLLQLIDSSRTVKGCDIIDYPAFNWRGYMVDAGRNFQTVKQLKQQIDMMGRYKLNVFHFHLTEDIAWRLQIKKYPALTAHETAQRDKGKFYSIEEMKDLIAYCKRRHITLVPEIDVPGHSQAFKRAMGADMQSPEGVAILKDIFNEISATYQLPYIHIGADEVEIKNPNFIKDICEVIRKNGTHIIAWAPGGKYDEGVIRQLWKEEGDKEVGNPSVRYIDSKFLYISDFDPLNTVVTIFNRQIGGKPQGDENLLGAEFCLWNDRKVNDETELINKNAVYPAMLAFAERLWRGGGEAGVNFHIGASEEKRALAFTEFEERLLSHKQKYFSKLPFWYAKQSHVRWKLFGPFENKGNLQASFWPEKNKSLKDSMAIVNATGGTIWLWHTHGPTVKAWLPSPKENTTWYAFTRFWSNTDSIIAVWIDLKDLSRSGADATPPAGQWDQMKSQLWVNGKPITPPVWTFPGRPSGRLEEPMVDENFYYRAPAKIKASRGWNEVLFKLPMGKFDPLLDWQVPPKWMFTFLPVIASEGVNFDAADIQFKTGR